MAGKSYTNLKAVLIGKIEALMDAQTPTPDTLFDHVYGVAETQPEGDPVCFVIEKTGGGQLLDTHRNQREWQFDIVIDVKIDRGRTPEAAYEALLDATDRVIQMLDEDPMLLDENGLNQCMWTKVVPVTFEWGLQDTSFHRARLTVGIVDVVNRYSPA